MRPTVKGEIPDAGGQAELGRAAAPPSDQVGVIELSSSESDDSEVEDEGEGERGRAKRSRVSSEGRAVKRQKKALEAALPLGFLDPLPPEEPIAVAAPAGPVVRTGCKQFWKAGDFDGGDGADSLALPAVGMDHVRVHPKFLHSNATSHKWALGALAELLDNSLDEVCNGATFVNIDMLENRKDGTRMLLVEDNGGGMDPDKMRQCMSLGYSTKCKIANTIGQYGNGFKTSTMRLGADVIVFSRSRGREGRSPTQSIGMLSYTFLRNTGKEDIVVPMLDYEKKGQVWSKLMRTSSVDWKTNVETIVQWSPYSNEQDLLQQFNSMPDQGTRIVIYNLWEDDQGELELDFDTDKHDIQVRGVNRDEKKIQMAKQFPNSRHFLTYRHSLRSYASILYLRLPRAFKMILRGKEIEHHNIVNDMMLKQEVTYRPQPGADGVPKDPNMVAVVTIGFVKDAKDHIDVQGFNVYYKNRLIKPFWRVWNAAGSDGRGVLGVLEANFVEPAHDKQDFERTIVLSRLEIRLIQMQKTYWTTHCHRIGYAPRRNKKLIESEDRESSREAPSPSSRHSSPFVGMSPNPAKYQFSDKSVSGSSKTGKPSTTSFVSAKTGNYKSSHSPASRDSGKKGSEKPDEDYRPPRSKLHGTSVANNESDSEIEYFRSKRSVNDLNGAKSSCAQRSLQNEITHPSLSTSPKSTYNRAGENHASNGAVGVDRISTRSQSKAVSATCNGNEPAVEDSELRIKQLKEENEALKERISKIEKSMLHDLQYERERNKSLTEQLRAAEKKLEESRKEQEALIDIFSEERSRRDRDEDSLRKKLKDSSATIQELLEKLGTVQSYHKP